jgi:cholesterol transport system auxiliary component
MNMLRMRRGRLSMIGFALAVGLSGCALMGGGTSATLYQLGLTHTADPADPPAATVNPVVILYSASSFDRQSQGDHILTATGNQVAYIADARWVEPAQEMFDGVAIRALERGPLPLRVIRAGAAPKADYVLAIAVSRFQADYASGRAGPDIVIESRSKLMRVVDRKIVGDWPLTVREPTQANRVSEIVSSFDRASDNVAAQVAHLTFEAVQGR